MFSTSFSSDVTVQLPCEHIHATSATGSGFADQTALAQNVICYFIDTVNSNNRLGCTATYSTLSSGVTKVVQVVSVPYQALAANQEYLLVIDIQHT